MALIAHALNRGDIAMAAIATVQMQLPDPPPFSKRIETDQEIAHRAAELHRIGLLKFWDPAKHPRTGTPPNPGWFAPVDGSEAQVMPAAMDRERLKHPERWFHPMEGEGGGASEGGPFPGGLSSAPRAASPGEATPTRQSPPSHPASEDAQPKLTFQGGLPPQLAPYKEGGKTSGVFRSQNLTIELQSGYDGPAEAMPPESSGFDRYTLSHVEGHAAALMRQLGIGEATVYINNPEICSSCEKLLPRMLPPASTLNVVLPNGTVRKFEGNAQ